MDQQSFSMTYQRVNFTGFPLLTWSTTPPQFSQMQVWLGTLQQLQQSQSNFTFQDIFQLIPPLKKELSFSIIQSVLKPTLLEEELFFPACMEINCTILLPTLIRNCSGGVLMLLEVWSKLISLLFTRKSVKESIQPSLISRLLFKFEQTLKLHSYCRQTDLKHTELMPVEWKKSLKAFSPVTLSMTCKRR